MPDERANDLKTTINLQDGSVAWTNSKVDSKGEARPVWNHTAQARFLEFQSRKSGPVKHPLPENPTRANLVAFYEEMMTYMAQRLHSQRIESADLRKEASNRNRALISAQADRNDLWDQLLEVREELRVERRLARAFVNEIEENERVRRSNQQREA